MHPGGGLSGRIGALALALMLAAPGVALSQGDPAVQTGVPAVATAENAVAAKERAIANAQRTAWQRYAAATGQNPNASASQIESMVTSMVVEQERSTLNGYSGRYTVRFRGAGVSAPPGMTASPGTGGGGAAVPPPSAPASLPPGTPPLLPLSAYVEAGTNFRSFDEWLVLRRRLLAQPSVGSVDILAISTEGARLRIGLRSPPNVAAQELAPGGIVLAPAAPPLPNGLPNPQTGPGWRIGLAGGA